MEGVDGTFGPVRRMLKAVALRKTCARQHTAQVSAASVHVSWRVSGGVGGGGVVAWAGFPALAHHVFVWEGPGLRRPRGKRLHSWCRVRSQAITFGDYTMCKCEIRNE